jgi:hypothetical protein
MDLYCICVNVKLSSAITGNKTMVVVLLHGHAIFVPLTETH